jgi:acyl carrier protein
LYKYKLKPVKQRIMNNKTKIIDKLKFIFEKNLNQKINDVSTLVFGKNKKWDSLKHIQIIVNIEKEFKVKIKTSEVGKLNSFNKLKNYIINN